MKTQEKQLLQKIQKNFYLIDSMTKISCIIVTCDMEKEKGFSVFHSICSILKQVMDDFELIIIDNSNKKDIENIKKIKDYSNRLNRLRKKPVRIELINNSKPLNINLARNIGAKKAKGDVLVFIEADTIILNKDGFSLIYKFSKKFDFGYGARRYWTSIGWFEKKTKIVLEELQEGTNELLRLNIGDYPENFKKKKDGEVFNDIQRHTFIANFGFCKREIFLKMKGFPLYDKLDLSDDCFIYRLLKSGYKYKFLNSISVVHISHKRNRINDSLNLQKYVNELVANGDYWCHIAKTFSDRINLSEIIEPLKEVHYDYRIKEMYLRYREMYPLNIKKGDKKITYWRKNNIFSIIDFSILIRKLIEAKNVDEYIKASGADFDNLAAIIKIAVKNDVVFINKRGKIFNSNYFDKKRPILKNNIKLIPKSDFNQFPCDIDSRIKRAEFLINRYPFVEYLRLAIIGEDDFLSPLLKDYANFQPIILEKDKRIIKKLKEIDKDVKVYNVDLANDNEFKSINIPKIKTFIVDPPYTINGLLTFIYRGLSLLSENKDIKEFYVILNPAMIGNDFYKIIDILTDSKVYLYEVINDFSQYKLPKNYKEYDRASNFLKNMHLSQKAITYSSSSSLYIFRTIKPKIDNIKRFINYSKIYQHYL